MRQCELTSRSRLRRRSPRRSASSSTSCGPRRPSPRRSAPGTSAFSAAGKWRMPWPCARSSAQGLLGGERSAVKIEGFDVGASPREFLEARDEPVIFSTTNGTRAILAAAGRCDEVYLGSLLNLTAVANCCSGAWGGRGRAVRRVPGRVRAGRCLLRRPDRAVARRRARRCGEGVRRDRGSLARSPRGFAGPHVRAAGASSRTSRSALR